MVSPSADDRSFSSAQLRMRREQQIHPRLRNSGESIQSFRARKNMETAEHPAQCLDILSRSSMRCVTLGEPMYDIPCAHGTRTTSECMLQINRVPAQGPA